NGMISRAIEVRGTRLQAGRLSLSGETTARKDVPTAPTRQGTPADSGRATADADAPMYRSAQSRKVGQFGPVVCPPACWRKAISPSTRGVSMGGKVEVPRSFLPRRR